MNCSEEYSVTASSGSNSNMGIVLVGDSSPGSNESPQSGSTEPFSPTNSASPTDELNKGMIVSSSEQQPTEKTIFSSSSDSLAAQTDTQEAVSATREGETDEMENVLPGKDKMGDISPEEDKVEGISPEKDTMEDLSPENDEMEDISPEKNKLEDIFPKKKKWKKLSEVKRPRN